MSEEPSRVRPRPNIAAGSKFSSKKRYAAAGYWLMLLVALGLIVWFLVASAVDRGEAVDAEATTVAERSAATAVVVE